MNNVLVFFFLYVPASFINASIDIEQVKESSAGKAMASHIERTKSQLLKHRTALMASRARPQPPQRRLSDDSLSYIYETEYTGEDCEYPSIYTAMETDTCLYDNTYLTCNSTTITVTEYNESTAFGQCGGDSTTYTEDLVTTCNGNVTNSCDEAPSGDIVAEMTYHLSDDTCGADSVISVQAIASECMVSSLFSFQWECTDDYISMYVYAGSDCSGDGIDFGNLTGGTLFPYDVAECTEINGTDVGTSIYMKVACDSDLFPGSTASDDDDDDDDDVCFSGDEILTLETGGSIRLSEVSIGDRVLSSTKDGALSFSDVVFLPHGPNLRTASFMEMTTSKNKQLSATKSHLMVTCEGTTVPAGSLTPGACLRTVDGDETITATKLVQKHGVYTAVTKNEFLVVGGVVVSPFAINHDLVHAYYNIHRFVYDYFPSVSKSALVTRVNAWLGGVSAAAYVSLFGKP